jgi:CBS domain-containing protein
MRSRRIRHLPVVQGGRLVGIISIGDVLVAAEADHTATIQYLHEYLYGEWR